MDLSTLPDLVQHFAFATHFVPDIAQHALEPVRNFTAAFGSDSPLSGHEKLYHMGKFAVLAGLLAVSVYEGNMEAILGTGFAEADEVYDMCRKGQVARHPAPPV